MAENGIACQVPPDRFEGSSQPARNRKPKPCTICRDDPSHRTEVCFAAGDFTVLQCLSCGLVYVDHAWDEEVTNAPPDAYPADLSFDEFAEIARLRFRARHPLYEVGLNLLETHSGERGRLLDIGCGTGHWLQVSERRGWEPFGLDLSTYCVEFVRQTMAYDVSAGTVEDCSWPDGFFDAATLWGVIEHMNDPSHTLQILHRKLRKGALILIDTPTEESLLKRISRCLYRLSLGRFTWHIRFFYGLPPGHVYSFTTATLSKLLHLSGYHLVEVVPAESSVIEVVDKWTCAKPGLTRLAMFSTSALFWLARVSKMPNRIVAIARRV